VANRIALKDYSFITVENKKLYKLVKNGANLLLDTSICEVVSDKKETKPILEIKNSSVENEVIITTFGYVGRFSYAGVTFDITYRFGEKLLDRMISAVNDFDVDVLEYEAKSSKKQSDNLAMKILYLNFIFKLKKLSIMGVPKSYEKIEHHDTKLRGQIDINRFMQKDIPFNGKIASTSYEQVYVQEIVDVLYSALQIVEKNGLKELITRKLFQIRNLIYNHSTQVFVNGGVIEKALHHKSIQNSLYKEFKPVLEIASYIISYENKFEYKANNTLNGLILDVSLLWESYLYKLLKEAFEKDEWVVLHEDTNELYKEQFYKRTIKPDIVIKNETSKEILVFDAKSKSMKFTQGLGDGSYGDLDRSDFFQINTYMTYYDKKGKEVIAGGLLYPIEGSFEIEKSHSDDWFDSPNTKFIVDGIDLSLKKDSEDKEISLTLKNIQEREDAFIERLKTLIISNNDANR